eukprot:TRINITY_DN22345_c0_g1_i1.p1 TRINITY_DN22345_c0_g1~~TRINITY_DN22345_c0_g1_i1.p1  ORF type:complete len:769 (+),score=160.20 TRINITY_DN22345_c0_g1_i1:49-2355(+)
MVGPLRVLRSNIGCAALDGVGDPFARAHEQRHEGGDALPELKYRPASAKKKRAGGGAPWRKGVARSVFDAPAPTEERRGKHQQQQHPLLREARRERGAPPSTDDASTPTQPNIHATPPLRRLSGIARASLPTAPPAALSGDVLEAEGSRKRLPPLLVSPEAHAAAAPEDGASLFDEVTLRDLEVWVSSRQALSLEHSETFERGRLRGDERRAYDGILCGCAREGLMALEQTGRRWVDWSCNTARCDAYSRTCRVMCAIYIAEKAASAVLARYFTQWLRALGVDRLRVAVRLEAEAAEAGSVETDPDAFLDDPRVLAGLVREQRTARSALLDQRSAEFEALRAEALSAGAKAHARSAVQSEELHLRRELHTAQLHAHWDLVDAMARQRGQILTVQHREAAQVARLCRGYYQTWWRTTVGLPHLLKHVDAWLLSDRFNALMRFRAHRHGLQRQVRREKAVVMGGTACALLTTRYWRKFVGWLTRRKARVLVHRLECQALLRLSARYYHLLTSRSQARLDVRAEERAARGVVEEGEQSQRSGVRRAYWGGLAPGVKVGLLQRKLSEPLYGRWVRYIRLYVVLRKLCRYHVRFRYRAWMKYARIQAGVRALSYKSGVLWSVRFQHKYFGGWMAWARRRRRLLAALVQIEERTRRNTRRGVLRTLRSNAFSRKAARANAEYECWKRRERRHRLLAVVPHLEAMQMSALVQLHTRYFLRLRLHAVDRGISRAVDAMAQQARHTLARRYLAQWTEWCCTRYETSYSITSSQMSLP